MLYNLTKFLLPSYARKIKEIFPYTTLKSKQEKYISVTTIFSFVISLSIALLLFNFSETFFVYDIIIFFALFFVFLVLSYTYLILNADKKASSIEQVLPDAMQLMASNLRAGITTDRALLLSAREEFGVFQEEIKKVSKKVSTGTSIDVALGELSKNVKSDIFERTIGMIVFGLRSGGELASLLEEAAASLRQQILTQKQVRTSVMMYVILVFIAIIFVSPMLFAISSVLIETLVKSIATIDVPTATAVPITMPLTISAVHIDSSFIFFFSLIVLAVTTILSSLVLGLIMTGEERNGLKFMPFLLFFAFVIFFITRLLLSNLLGAFF